MNIGMQEILVISVLALIVLGPERLPTAIKTLAIWLNRCRRSFNELKSVVEREINADEIRQQIHNDNVLHELGETRDALDQLGEQLSSGLESEADKAIHKEPHKQPRKEQHKAPSDEQPIE